jgi:hypothetical protein
MLAKVPRPPASVSAPPAMDRLTWAVETVSRFVPAATCLTQALAAQVLLTRRGRAARLHIGVSKAEGRKLEAHAWVESQGRVVIGGSGLERYTVLAVLSGPAKRPEPPEE